METIPARTPERKAVPRETRFIFEFALDACTSMFASIVDTKNRRRPSEKSLLGQTASILCVEEGRRSSRGEVRILYLQYVSRWGPLASGEGAIAGLDGAVYFWGRGAISPSAA